MTNYEPQLEWAKQWLTQTRSCYIDGAWHEAGGDELESINPATGEVIGKIKGATGDDVDLAVQAARRAFDEGPWRKSITHQRRGQIMREIARLIRDDIEQLATLETLDNGKLFTEACEDVTNVADFFDYYSGWTDKFHGEVNPTNNYFSYTRRDPVGVCGQIIPWNYPMDMAGYKLAPALAMGNTILIKPSSMTSMSLVRLFEIIHESGLLPAGVLNLILGKGRVGSFITRHPQVDKTAFTGSTAVGKQLVHDSADSNLKTLSLELGGKSANIIFDDAPDLQYAITRSFVAMFSGKGEKCTEPTRLFVQRGVYDQVVAGLAAEYDQWVVGDPFDPASNQGAQVSAEHFAAIMEYIEIGKAEGARLLCGGDRNVEGSNAKGWFINPTIFVDASNDMRIAQEEIFGPVLTVIPFDTEDEAVAMANDSIYALAAGFWTNDVARTQRVANALQAGQVFINRYGCYDPASPFGGHKQSGWGQECGIRSLELYTKPKAIWYAN